MAPGEGTDVTADRGRGAGDDWGAVRGFHTEVLATTQGLFIALIGELDGEAVAAAQTIVDTATPGEHLAVDLRRLTFIDSAGLRMLLDWHHRVELLGGRLVLHSPSDAVDRVLAATGLHDVFDIADPGAAN